MAGPYQFGTFSPTDNASGRYSPGDQSLQMLETANRPMSYQVVSSNTLNSNPIWNPQAQASFATVTRRSARKSIRKSRPMRACRKSAGPGGKRGDADVPNRLDGAIAANIERHLRTAFRYTLDLTSVSKLNGATRWWPFCMTSGRGIASISPGR